MSHHNGRPSASGTVPTSTNQRVERTRSPTHEQLLAFAREIAPHAKQTLDKAQRIAVPIVAEAIETWERDGVLG